MWGRAGRAGAAHLLLGKDGTHAAGAVLAGGGGVHGHGATDPVAIAVAIAHVAFGGWYAWRGRNWADQGGLK
jgi:hypothetical protein